MSGWTFCPHCEVFFGAPVPPGIPGSSSEEYIIPIDRTAHRSAKTFRNFASGICVAAMLLLGILLFGANRATVSELKLVAQRPSSVTETMQADIVAEKTGTYAAYVTAADLMIGVTENGSVRHRTLTESADHVTVVVDGGVGPRRAHAMAEYATLQLLDIRSRFMAPLEAKAISVAVYDMAGHRMGHFDGDMV